MPGARFLRLLPVLAALLALASAQARLSWPAAAQQRDARNYVYVLAAQPFAGRETPSPGLDAAARFVASKLAEWGLQPAGQPATPNPLRAFFLPIALASITPDLDHTQASLQGHRFRYGRDYAAAGPLRGAARGPLEFVGDATGLPPSLDVRGKILVVAGAPAPQAYARAHGAVGIVLLPGLGQIITMLDPGAAGEMMATNSVGLASGSAFTAAAQADAASLRAPRLEMPRLQSGAPALPVITAGPVLLNALFAGEKLGATQVVARAALHQHQDAFAFSPAKILDFRLAARVTNLTTQDVVAFLPGSDPALASQYVLLSAHLDHLGPGFPGADDDASGSAALLCIAHAFARGPRPRRSLLFVWHAGEEKGLWGSEYFTRFPPSQLQPLAAHIVADLNMDMIGRSKAAGDGNPLDQHLARPGEVFIVGPEVSSTDLEATLEAVNATTLHLALNHYWDRTDDHDRIFYRSDQFNYARLGIPIAFFTDGLHADYHRPSDTPDKLDYAQLDAIAHTVAAVAWQLATQPARPRLNAHLPPELVAAMQSAH